MLQDEAPAEEAPAEDAAAGDDAAAGGEVTFPDDYPNSVRAASGQDPFPPATWVQCIAVEWSMFATEDAATADEEARSPLPV